MFEASEFREMFVDVLLGQSLRVVDFGRLRELRGNARSDPLKTDYGFEPRGDGLTGSLL
jgi:hypothetical protein